MPYFSAKFKALMYRISCFLGCLWLAACSSGPATFSSEKVEQVDFSAYKTFAFLPTKDTAYTKLISRQKMEPMLGRQAVAILNKKGLTLDKTAPDCFFTYTLVVNQKFSTSADKQVSYNAQIYNSTNLPPVGYNSYGSGVGYMPYSPSVIGANTDIYYFSSDNRPVTYYGKMTLDTLREGSMIIDMIDAKTKRVVWRSVAQNKTPEAQRIQTEAQIEAVLKEMLHKFPKK